MNRNDTEAMTDGILIIIAILLVLFFLSIPYWA